MSKKKEILFVMNNLNVGGAEKALVSLLQVFDYEKYNVDLLLFKKEGLFLSQVSHKVNVLNEPQNYRYFDMPFSQVLRENFFKGKWNIIYRRIQFKIQSGRAKNIAEAEQFGWKPLSKTLEILPKNYDAAIGFLEKTPNYYIIDKVKSQKKIGWIQNDYEKLGMNVQFDQNYFLKFDKIVLNSITTTESFKQIFPEFASKSYCIENIVSCNLINSLGNEKIYFKYKQPVFTSAGRLTRQKGFDLGIEAAKILKDRNIDFHWLIMGIGEEQNALQHMIENYELKENISLIGIKENPYAYINNSLFYFHPSRFEGKSVIVDEVKTLCKPILLTNYPSAKDQINHSLNGYICDLDVEAIANTLQEFLENENLRDRLSNKLSEEKWSNENEINKLHQLIES